MLLRAIDIVKSYSGIHALRGVSFSLEAGEVHALVGENGAGKSTLIKIITGATDANSGRIEIDGTPLTHNTPLRAKAAGIAAIYQHPALLPDLSVMENIALANEPAGAWRRIDWGARRIQAEALLRRAGAEIDPDAPASSLTMSEQQLVEIAKALGAKARILILDEPTASLSHQEAERLFTVIRGMRAEGVGIIYISHRLEELAAIVDRVTVLRDGNSIGTYQMAEVDRPMLIRLMVGRDVGSIFPKRNVNLGDTVLELRNLGSRAAGISGVSLSVRAGEILGVGGLAGAGRTPLAEIVFGITSADSGEILVRGTPVQVKGPEDAIRNGIAYVPEDRQKHGLILPLSVLANTTLSSLGRVSRGGFLRDDYEVELSAEFARKLGTKTASLHQPVSSLSGGNQQKVLLARWLAAQPAVLILDEPTQGVDVGAKAEIHALISELAAAGLAILLISSELPELLGMSDRVLVMRGGQIVGELGRGEATQQRVLNLALGEAA